MPAMNASSKRMNFTPKSHNALLICNSTHKMASRALQIKFFKFRKNFVFVKEAIEFREPITSRKSRLL